MGGEDSKGLFRACGSRLQSFTFSAHLGSFHSWPVFAAGGGFELGASVGAEGSWA